MDRAGAHRVRRAASARHVGRRRSGAAARPRFALRTLVTVCGVALVAGVGTGAAADRVGEPVAVGTRPLPTALPLLSAAGVAAAPGASDGSILVPDRDGAPPRASSPGTPAPGRASGAERGAGGVDPEGEVGGPDVVGNRPDGTLGDGPEEEADVVPSPPSDADAGTDAEGLTGEDRAAGVLAAAVPPQASGALHVVAGEEPAPHDAARVVPVRVEVEQGLAVDPEAFAVTVMEILNDPRGWGGDGSVVFARTEGAAPVRVTLASPRTVDALCAPLRTVSLYSCGRGGVAALNAMRWVEGSPEFDDMTSYRQYLVNHEVGHLLGHQHVGCPGEGLPAPIMQQQTIAVAPCVPNGWPFPDG